MPRSRQGPRSFEAGLLQWAPCQSTGLSFGSTVMQVRCVLLPDSSSSYLKKVTFLTPPSPAPLAWHLRACSFQTMRLARRCIHGSAPAFYRHTCLNTVFRSARSPADHTCRSITPPFCRSWISVHSRDEHCNYWPLRICGCLSCGMEQSSARTPWQKH